MARVADDQIMYHAVSARRLQWDNLVWQVPLLSLTAQAFLFTIALGEGSSRVARAIAALLSLVATVLSIALMARHRQAELADAAWLEQYERHRFGESQAVHGETFRKRRDATKLNAPPIGDLIPILPGFVTWVVRLGVFGLAALAVLLLTALFPNVLA